MKKMLRLAALLMAMLLLVPAALAEDVIPYKIQKRDSIVRYPSFVSQLQTILLARGVLVVPTRLREQASRFAIASTVHR